jgi:hypothetical protein
VQRGSGATPLSAVQVAQQAIDCFGDFSGYHS